VLPTLRTALAQLSPRRVPGALAGFRQAAVLVPVLLRPDGPSVLLTERAGELRAHAGQIAFPGGKLEADDPDLETCALREAEEEVGLPRTHVELIGRLDEVPTPSMYVITPVVGIVDAPPAWVPQAIEVAAIFEVPIAALREPGVYVHQGTREWAGIRYEMHAYQAGDRLIWGATARVLWQLLALAEDG
jgi:8-oxo-dGTP pyrophosphatase MutT (NUDIX family)